MRVPASLGVLALLLPVLAGADTVTVAASKDNTLYSEDGALSNGAGQHIFVGTTNDNFQRRAVIAFDVAAVIPAGSTVTSVTLTLHLSRTRTTELGVALHRVTAAWGEGSSDAPAEEGTGAPAELGDATWTHRLYPATAWSQAGGDFAATASALALVGKANGPYSWSSPGLVSDVQGWLDAPATNHGWILVSADAATKETKRFDSRTHPTVGVRPLLTVVFTPSTPTGACCAADGTCGVVAAPGTTCTGAYQGQGTVCTPNPCPQPAGACCLPVAAATCEELTESVCAASGGEFRGVQTACASDLCPVVLTPFVDPLPIPRVAQPVSGTPGGAASYVMSIVQRTQRLHSELPPTTVWGVDDGQGGGVFPGPTVEATTGTPLTVTWRNDLRDATGALRTSHYLPVDTCLHGAEDQSPRTVLHLHGGHVPEAVDGYPEATFLPGAQVTYDYPNEQRPGTLWYHDHALGITRLNVYMGIAGYYLLRDAVELALALPSGAYEVPLAIQDRTFHPDGSLRYPALWEEHFFGDKVLVNGAVWPYLEVARGKYRFRVLNGSGSRTYALRLSDGATFFQIGTDLGLLPAPVALTSLTLGPGERADLVVDFAAYAAGTELVLQNDAPAPYPSGGGPVVAQVMKFVVQNRAGHTAALPPALRPVPRIPEGEAVRQRDFLLNKTSDPCTGSSWRINGLGWMDITEFPRLGTTEIWRFINDSGAMHPMHMHLVQFQVLDRQPFVMVSGVPTPTGPAVAPAPNELGWKDTVQVGPSEMVRVIARFDDFVGRYAYHCHILEHEDHEMMRQFQTTTECGDGTLGRPDEQCDDGNTDPGDGCSATCALEPPDAGVPDAGVPDAGEPDAGEPDAGEPDAGEPDSGTPDAGEPDAGEADAGLSDAGSDAGIPDAGTPDSGQPDGGAGDGGTDGGPSGGCGCSAGFQDGSWVVLAALGFGTLLRRRRRVRR